MSCSIILAACRIGESEDAVGTLQLLDALCIAATEAQILVSFWWVSLERIFGSEEKAHRPLLAGFRHRDGENSISTLLDRYSNRCQTEYPRRKVGAQISDMCCISITELHTTMPCNISG